MGIISYQINPNTFFNWLKIHLISHSPIKVNTEYILNIAGITYIIKYLERTLLKQPEPRTQNTRMQPLTSSHRILQYEKKKKEL